MHADWRDDLRAAFKKAGAAGRDVALVFSDTQIVWEGMLEDINNVLNTGAVPNLLKPEDLEEISAALRPAMLAEGLAVTPAAVTAFFTRRVRSQLHLLIAMSPLGDAFRRRLRMFPALVNCCTIDWFREWPLDALQSVAHHFYRVRPCMPVAHPFHQVSRLRPRGCMALAPAQLPERTPWRLEPACWLVRARAHALLPLYPPAPHACMRARTLRGLQPARLNAAGHVRWCLCAMRHHSCTA
jgi:hypothetical protein